MDTEYFVLYSTRMHVQRDGLNGQNSIYTYHLEVIVNKLERSGIVKLMLQIIYF